MNNNPTEDVTVRILWNDLQKETEKKYSVYNVEKRGSMPSLKAGKKIEVITRSDNAASVQFNVTKWFMLYSCLCRCPRLALKVNVQPRNFMPGEAWRELRAAEREREACRGHKIKKPDYECRAINN